MKLDEIYIRDPFILLENGVYYMYGKRDEGHLSFWVYKSPDLENWEAVKPVFVPPEDFWSDRDFWAPEVHKYNGRFYMLASFKAEGKNRGTQILVADAPDGDFVPITKEPVTPRDWMCLDGTLYVDKKGKPHMVFCHEWLQIGDGTVCEMELSEDLTRTVSEPRLLFSASDYAACADIDPEMKASKVTDGPFFYRTETGALLCIWSSFNKDGGYAELIARSDNGDIDGSWTVDQAPLAAENGGHGMIFEAQDGRNMLVLHRPNFPAGSERAQLTEIVEIGDTIKIKE